MSEPFIGEIRPFGFNFAPRGWAFCNGQLVQIAQNTALFSILGTTYGGNGVTTFALPNLQDRHPMHPGQGAGLTPRVLGETGGQASVTLTTAELPAHAHAAAASALPAATTAPSAAVLPSVTNAAVYGPAVDTVPMSAAAVAPSGAGAPHENRQPFLALNFCIALQGIFPSRN